MPRKQKVRPTEPLAPIPAEILEQFVRQGPLTPEELDATVRRFKKPSSNGRSAPSSVTIWGTSRAAPSRRTPPIIATGAAGRRS